MNRGAGHGSIPQPLVYTAQFLRHATTWKPYAKTYFSQEGEDIVLQRLFVGQRAGFYVDVGAHHPWRFSNTAWAYRRGWRGVNIDARPGVASLFSRARPRDITVEVAIGLEEGRRTFHVFDDPALNTIDKDRRAYLEANSPHASRSITVRQAPLALVLHEAIPNDVEAIDFMSIDVEGSEWTVLNSNDWSRYRPTVVVLEILDSRLSDVLESKEVRFLSERGYTPLAMLYHSVIFALEQ